MTRKYRLYQVDSFTKEKFAGNPAGVIPNADGLSEEEMQKIAKELNNSETAFIFTPEQAGYDAYVRFFTPTTEVPICGHATIAAHYVRATEMKLDSSRIHHRTGAGILPVDIVKEKDDYRIVMTQGKIEFGSILEGEHREKLLEALHLKENDLAEGQKIQIVSLGHSKVMIGIRDTNTLHALTPDYDGLTRLSSDIGCNGYYVFTLNPEDPEVLIHGRMFAPAIGINEDPATGNANGPLGAYLVHHHLVKHDQTLYRFRAKQGEAIKRPGMIQVEVDIAHNEPVGVRISGNAVIAFQSEIIL